MRASILGRGSKSSEDIQEQVRRAQEEKAKNQQLLLVRRAFREPEFLPDRPPSWFATLQRQKQKNLLANEPSQHQQHMIGGSPWITQMRRGESIRENQVLLSRQLSAAGESRRNATPEEYSSSWTRILTEAGADTKETV
jgi:hypothetical protein